MTGSEESQCTTRIGFDHTIEYLVEAIFPKASQDYLPEALHTSLLELCYWIKVRSWD